jgi:hypothetical protein
MQDFISDKLNLFFEYHESFSILHRRDFFFAFFALGAKGIRLKGSLLLDLLKQGVNLLIFILNDAFDLCRLLQVVGLDILHLLLDDPELLLSTVNLLLLYLRGHFFHLTHKVVPDLTLHSFLLEAGDDGDGLSNWLLL